jgi:hypothetical protein
LPSTQSPQPFHWLVRFVIWLIDARQRS